MTKAGEALRDGGAAARFLVRNSERGPAAAGGHDVRVGDVEAGAHEGLCVVDGRAVDVAEAGRIDQHADAAGLEDVVVVLLLVERERVLEARAAAAAHANPKPD